MILCFPSPESFRVLLTSSLLPTDLTFAPASLYQDDDGRLFVETATKLNKKTATELTKLDVTAAKAMPGPGTELSCWAEGLPMTRVPTLDITTQAPVIFAIPSQAEFTGFVTELIRLGNDRLGFRIVEWDKQVWFLLRVIGPPYFTWLRAVDDPTQRIPAFTEAAPRVWQQAGYRHPLADQLTAPEARQVFLPGNGRWWAIDDEAFADVYSVLSFPIPDRKALVTPLAHTPKMQVTLRLEAGNAAEEATLWVIDHQAESQLDEFLKTNDDRTIQQLRFAVVTEPNREPVVILRTATNRSTGLVLAFQQAVGYRQHPALSNLFVPVGRRLAPSVRRDVLRGLLAPNEDLLVWLKPEGAGNFVPMQLADTAFHRLEDWVEYVLDRAALPMQEWIESSQFVDPAVACADDPEPRPPRDPGTKLQRNPKANDSTEADIVELNEAPVRTPSRDEYTQPTRSRDSSLAVWKAKREELQKQFLSVEGSLNTPERLALWPELAVANTGAGDQAEASLCWSCAVWSTPNAKAELYDGWLQAEFGQPLDRQTEAEWDALLQTANPLPGDVRRVAVLTCSLATLKPNHPWLVRNTVELQRLLERNEQKLPTRVLWLASTTLANVNGADVLGLAAMYDKLLQRLLERGLSTETDVSFFLRTAGLHDADRVRFIRDEAAGLYESARRWAEVGCQRTTSATAISSNITVPMVDLLFAFLFAKLGESSTSSQLVEKARKVLMELPADQASGLVACWVYEAMTARIDTAASEGISAFRLPESLKETVSQYTRTGKGKNNTPHGLSAYVIQRLLEQSRVIAPMEAVNPYADGTVEYFQDDYPKLMHQLQQERDPQRLSQRLKELYQPRDRRLTPKMRWNVPATEPHQLQVLIDGLPLASRCGSVFATEMLQVVPEVLSQPFSTVSELWRKQAKLLERALFLAGHYDQRELLAQLMMAFVSLVNLKPIEQQLELINSAAGLSIRNLRKLGLRDDLDRLMQQLAAVVWPAGSLNTLRTAYSGKPEVWLKLLTTLTYLAGGWYGLGLADRADPILSEVFRSLEQADAKPSPQETAKLVSATVLAISQRTTDDVIKLFNDLFRNLHPGKIINTYSTAPFFSRLHLNVVEDVVLALVNDDFSLSSVGKRWIEEDEQLVRQRLHADMKRHLR